MEGFTVTSAEVGLQILIVGLITGVALYALEKFVFTPAEAAVGLGS